MATSKRYVHLEPQNVTASGIKVFVDIIKDLEMRSSHIMVGPTSSEECFYKGLKSRKAQKHRGEGQVKTEAESEVMHL